MMVAEGIFWAVHLRFVTAYESLEEILHCSTSGQERETQVATDKYTVPTIDSSLYDSKIKMRRYLIVACS